MYYNVFVCCFCRVRSVSVPKGISVRLLVKQLLVIMIVVRRQKKEGVYSVSVLIFVICYCGVCRIEGVSVPGILLVTVRK